MKARIKYMAYGEKHQKTIEVSENEPNSIIREFIRESLLPKTIYISTVECGLQKYVWDASAKRAFAANPFCASTG